MAPMVAAGWCPRPKTGASDYGGYLCRCLTGCRTGCRHRARNDFVYRRTRAVWRNLPTLLHRVVDWQLLARLPASHPTPPRISRLQEVAYCRTPFLERTSILRSAEMVGILIRDDLREGSLPRGEDALPSLQPKGGLVRPPNPSRTAA